MFAMWFILLGLLFEAGTIGYKRAAFVIGVAFPAVIVVGNLVPALLLAGGMVIGNLIRRYIYV